MLRMTLSRSVKEAFKTALAITIAYAVGLSLDWDRPYWAAFAVAFISLDTVGQSLNKGALRLAGTVGGAVVALTLVGLFAQDRWLFMFFASLWLGFCVYMNMGPRYQYAWFVAGFVSLIIAIDGGANSANAFATAVLRMQQTGLGILVYSLVSLLLWPVDSQRALQTTLLDVVDVQQKLFGTGMKLLRGSNGQELMHSLHAREVTALTSLDGLLGAALIDSDEVRSAGHGWQECRSQLKRLAMALQRWQENFPELQSLPLERLLPNLGSFALEIDARFALMAQLIRGQSTEDSYNRISLDVNAAALAELSHFQRAALLLTHRHLREIDTLTAGLLDTLSGIRDFSGQTQAPKPGAAPRLPLTLDPDRLVAAGKIMLTLWLAFLAVIYVGDFPGGLGFISMLGAFGMILISNQQMPMRMLIGPVALSIFIAGTVYILVMPQLSSFTGLGIMIFIVTFSICYRYAAPQKAINRAISLALFVIVIAVSNQQSYSFLSVANTALMFALLFLLLGVIAYIPFRPFPERTLLRLLGRYFRSTALLLAEQRPTASAPPTRRVCFHQREVASLPSKMQLWVGQADPALLGERSVQELPLLIGKLHVISYRLQALQDARALPQSPHMEVLVDDMQNWRAKLIEVLNRLSENPADCETLMRSKLDNVLRGLETRIAQALDATTAREISDRDSENLYALLGTYRGMSEALLDLARSLDQIDWQPWYEERFA